MRIDAHHHLWKYDADAYPWIDDAMSVLARDHLPPELAEETAAVDIGGTVAVQARQSEEETRWLLAQAQAHPIILGVVGWVDLTAVDLEARLDELAHPLLKGLRHIVQDEPDPRFLLGDEFKRGVASLACRGLVYDILVYHHQMAAAVEFARGLPDQPLVLDHLGKPPIRDGALEPWSSQIKALAELPNVSCKISGMVTEARWDGWKPEDLAPYLDIALEAFGEDRVLFGSDWPVCRLAAPYGDVVAVVEERVGARSESFRNKLMGANAARIYGL